MQMRSRFVFLARMWLYFRIGYATYLTFVLGAANTLVVVWYLAIREAPGLEAFFGSRFLPFAVVTCLLGMPLSIGLGWIHYKGSPLFSSETDIGVESNPWNYKWAPGFTREVVGPMWLLMLTQIKRLLQAQNLLDDQLKASIEDIERKMQVLNEGGMIGATSPYLKSQAKKQKQAF